jgi:flagellar motor protein MotB
LKVAIKSNKEQQRHAKDDKPKIIIKKAKGHQGGHHGGAWKVVYADFVTAIMALFIVLWVLGASGKKFKAGIAHYFREPGVFSGSRGIISDDEFNQEALRSDCDWDLVLDADQLFQSSETLFDIGF